MTDYSHAIGGERNEGLVDTIQTALGPDPAFVSDTPAEGSDIDAESFEDLCRTIPQDVLASTDLGQLKGGHSKRIRDLRTDDDGHLIRTKVQVDFVSETFSLPTEIIYSCKQCGERQRIQQDTKNQYKTEPPTCINGSCRSQQFIQDEETLVDKQIARVSDLPEGKEQSESALVHLYGDHIGTVSSGDTLVISGVIKHVEVSPNNNETKTEREIVVTHIKNQDAQEIQLSGEDIEWIESLENPVEVLLESIAPHLVGIDDKKRGTLHTLVSGHEMEFKDLRTKSHILHIGDPSTGKSDLISWFNNILPNSIYAAAESATGVGLTATVEREERLGGKWVCHAGTLVKANEGHAFVDELGEFSEDDQNKLRTALSKGEVIMNKASIQDRHLPASSRLVGSANPIDGEFNRFDPPADQFDMPSPILSRMDLVYIWTTEDQDTEAVAHAVANKYITTDDSTQDPPLAPEEVGKYIYYVMNEYQPDINPEVANAVATVWQQLNDETDGNVDTRDEDAIMRLAISSARLHRRDTVTIEDVEAAKEMKVDSLRQMGNGDIDAQVKYTGELTEQSAARKAVLSTVETAELIEDEELVAELEDYPETTVRHFIEKHLNEGRITRVSGGDLAMNS